MSLVNQLGEAEDPDVFHDTEAQDGQALFHRAGLMLRLGKQVCSRLHPQFQAVLVSSPELKALVAPSSSCLHFMEGLNEHAKCAHLGSCLRSSHLPSLLAIKALADTSPSCSLWKHTQQISLHVHCRNRAPLHIYALLLIPFTDRMNSIAVLSLPTSHRPLCLMQDNFLELMLPVIGDSIRQAEQHEEGHTDAAGPLDPSIAKALRRRQRGISSKKDLAEAGTVFKVIYTTLAHIPFHSCPLHWRC